ncbi:MAG: glycosyltransferase family 4 protein [Flavisolibacter sp.]
MKIAQVAPLYESVPPKFYGGTERIVHYLTEELVSSGHKVTLFASGDSQTNAELIPVTQQAIRLNAECEDGLALHIVQIQEVLQRANQFDVIHFHTDYLHFPFSQNLKVPHLTTLHGRLSIPELQVVYQKFKNPVVSISNDQRKPLPQANFIATVYHGLPLDLHKTGTGNEGYLAFLGRISPEKGIDMAIEWAEASGVPLKIAAKVDKIDKEYFETRIKPLFNHPRIEFIGEINEKQKTEFLGNALALLFPINWNEPFGIVLIEAMACGTPVIARGLGSVPEIIQHGENGFIANETREAVEYIHQAKFIDRTRIRSVFENRFSSKRMAEDYLKLYQKLCLQKSIDAKLIGLRDQNNKVPAPGITKLAK